MPRVPVSYIIAQAKARNLDPQAVLAVAKSEGLGGGVGDSGTSFGPWQLHIGGALPSRIPKAQAQAWAWSPEGINYALDQIAKVAAGLRGKEAVANIVQRFERPADPAGEIQRALGYYGGDLPASAGPQGTSAKRPSAKNPLPAQAAAPALVALPDFQPAQASNMRAAQSDLHTYISGLLPQASAPAAPTPVPAPIPLPAQAAIQYKLPSFLP